MARAYGEAETVQRILQEATTLFVARGYEGVSMREIAEKVGITKAALYYHFEDKEALFMAILNASLAEISGVLDHAEATGSGAREQIAETVRGLLGLPAERRALIRVASQEIVHVGPQLRAAFNKVYEEKFVGRIAGMLAAGMEHGELRGMDPQLAAWLLLGMAYPFFHPGQADEAATKIGETLVGVFFDGIGMTKTWD